MAIFSELVFGNGERRVYSKLEYTHLHKAHEKWGSAHQRVVLHLLAASALHALVSCARTGEYHVTRGLRGNTFWRSRVADATVETQEDEAAS